MKFSLVIITCPGREALLMQTIESLLASDFGKAGWSLHRPGSPAGPGHPATRIYIKSDETTFERRQERQEHNSLAALKLVLDHPQPPEVILFCEDDVIFNQHLRHNLESWKPLQAVQNPGGIRDHFFFGSLYDPTIRELKMVPEDHYFIAEPEAVYGSQCFVMSRAMAEYFVAHWWEVPGMQDIKMSRLAARLAPIHYHLPSLVQHVGFTSVWGGHFHDTKMFDANFRAD